LNYKENINPPHAPVNTYKLLAAGDVISGKAIMKPFHQDNKSREPGKTEDAEYIRHPSELNNDLDNMKPIDKEREREDKKEKASLTDNERNVSKAELEDLTNAEKNIPSAESRSNKIPDTEDNDGTPLNEGPEEDDILDTGEHFDVPPPDLSPDDETTT
jgi:hypothetical protein